MNFSKLLILQFQYKVQMGRCTVCGSRTRFDYPLCWAHYYFNFRSGRFWVAFVLTIVLEYLLNFPVISQEGLLIMLIKALFDATGFTWFIIGAIIAEALVFVSSLMTMNYLVHKWFYGKKALI